MSGINPAGMDALPVDSVVVYETIWGDGSKRIGAAKRDDLGYWWTTDGEYYSSSVIASAPAGRDDARVIVRVVYRPDGE